MNNLKPSSGEIEHSTPDHGPNFPTLYLNDEWMRKRLTYTSNVSSEEISGLLEQTASAVLMDKGNPGLEDWSNY